MKKIILVINIIICLILIGCGPSTTNKVTSITPNQTEIVLNLNEQTTITYTVTPNQDIDVTWSVLDPNIAEVSEGILTAKSIGSTTVTITYVDDPQIYTTIDILVKSKTYKINYILDGGIFEFDFPLEFEENIGLDFLPTPTKNGYIFIGWLYNDEIITSIDANFNQDITLTATWEKEVIKPTTYQITYELDGGLFTTDYIYEYTENIGLDTLPTPEKSGYTFKGWLYNNELITSIDANFNQDITLTAIWEKELTDEIEEIELIIDLINQLPYYTSYNDKVKVDYIRSLYNELSKESKELVTNIDILDEKTARLIQIKNKKDEITYVLGDNIYMSKDELFLNFFSDFYTYIKNYHGTTYLEEKGINNIDDFLNIAKDDDAGRGQMREIGDIAGNYMLKKDINGILENQPESTFFGFCYKNNLYTDLLPFFIRFFAYWRIDEGYAKPTNYGADIFAESWAPTVDIAKFFYYNKDTSYVKTERMLDCFNNTANVAYGYYPKALKANMTLPTDITLRGYTFLGWYDNPEFTGTKIETITDTSKKVILYAKWAKNDEQIQQDNAEIVNIYIYNLTTTQANLTKKTVKYVSDMYENLSPKAKQLVHDLDILKEYEQEFKDYFLDPITINITYKLPTTIDLSFIQQDFINDFNKITSSSITSPEEFITKHYANMKKISNFFRNEQMMSKWGYLLDLLYTEESFYGIEIQVNRIKNKESGDTEYVTKALGHLLQQSNATTDKEILVDYSNVDLISSYGTLKITFEKPTTIPTNIINIDGYTFIGFFDENNNQIKEINETTPNNLYALFA